MDFSILAIFIWLGCFLLVAVDSGMCGLSPVFWLESVILLSFGITWLTKGQLFFRDEGYRKGP